MKITAIDGIEFVVKIKIGTVNGDRDEIVHRQTSGLQGLLDRVHHQPRFRFRVGSGPCRWLGQRPSVQPT